jgi:radical SAM protein with 4Fe4S-binding SPASM domain
MGLNIAINYLDPATPKYSDLYVSGVNDKIFCTATTTRLAIRSDGQVFPCVYAFEKGSFCAGNATKESIEQIWLKDDWKIFRGGISVNDLSDCKSCKYKKACSLKLCRLRALAVNGDLFGIPPNCYKFV